MTGEHAGAAFDRAVARDLKRNVTAQLLNGMLGMTGFRLVQAPTFVPAYLFALSGSELVVGLARSLQAGGTVLSPFISASLIGHRSHILPTTLALGMLMRLQILGIALAGFALGSGQTLYAVLVMMALMGFFQGMSQVTMNALRAKVIPVHRRGVVSGARNFLAGLCSAAVSYVAGAYVVEQNLLGNGYASVFLLAFVLGVTGLLGLGITREPEAVDLRPRETVRGAMARLPALLRDDPAFARFFVARALGAFGRMAMPFYILYAGNRIELSGAMLGLLTTVWMVTASFATLMWGLVADRHGHRIVMLATLVLWMSSNAQLMFAGDFAGIVLFFVIMGSAQGGFNQASQNLLLTFGSRGDIPLRLAASGTAVNFIATIGPVLGGAIVAATSFEALFVCSIALQSIAFATLLGVREPRVTARHGP